MHSRAKLQRLKKARLMSSFETNASADSPGVAQASAGEMLKAARERSGMHIAALAVMLKVPVKKLEALETSRFDLLPDTVFVRALAASVCRTLKIDAAPIMERLPHTGVPQLLFRGGTVSAPFRSPRDVQGASMWSGLPKPAIAAVLLLLVASLVVAFLPTLTTQFVQISAFVEKRMAIGNGTVGNGLANTTFDSKSETSLTDLAVAPIGAPKAAALLPSGQISDTAALAPLLQGSPSAAASAGSAIGVVVFRAIGESWVEVTDAKKQTVLRRTLATGESVGVSGVLPLSATVGRANMTQVDVRGQAFDLTPWSKDNVARFEVK